MGDDDLVAAVEELSDRMTDLQHDLVEGIRTRDKKIKATRLAVLAILILAVTSITLAIIVHQDLVHANRTLRGERTEACLDHNRLLHDLKVMDPTLVRDCSPDGIKKYFER